MDARLLFQPTKAELHQHSRCTKITELLRWISNQERHLNDNAERVAIFKEVVPNGLAHYLDEQFPLLADYIFTILKVMTGNEVAIEIIQELSQQL